MSTTLAWFVATLVLTAASGLLLSRMGRGHGGGLEQWGLGGRQFGTLVTWFLVGGDFYTAYTILAVPALVFGTGAAGFFALPYTILVYPFVFVVMPRLWTVCRTHGLVTAADFVELRYGNQALTYAIALTGILAVIPYIALQFAGIESVLAALHLGAGAGWSSSLPILLAFAAVSLFTVVAGLRGPALIAFSKDTMIYIVVLAAVVVLPSAVGGYHAIFEKAAAHFAQSGSGNVILQPAGYSSYVTLALGSALAAFLYPHTVTSVLASSSANVLRKNAILLPAYTLLLGLIALLGLAGVAAGLHLHSPKEVIPALFAVVFPHWFLGFAFAAIVTAALVPASIMSIAAANLFTRNFYRAGEASGAGREALVAKVASVAVNACALLLVLLAPSQYAINLQLMGGVLILQTAPAIVLGLWSLRLHSGSLAAGWLVGVGASVALLASNHLQSALTTITVGHNAITVYIGLLTLAANLVVVAVGSVLAGTSGQKKQAAQA